MTIAMITHPAPGDTFWDIIRKGAEAAAAKDNVDLQYSNDADADQAGPAHPGGHRQEGRRHRGDRPNTGALGAVDQEGGRGGHPGDRCSTPAARTRSALGAIGYFGQDEKDAGQAAGKRARHATAPRTSSASIQEQGQQQLEDRCDGVTQGARGRKVEQVYVNGTRRLGRHRPRSRPSCTQDKSIDWVVTLGAPFALDAVKAVKGAGSTAKIVTFDTNQQLVAAVQDGYVAWAIDQQPYLQGYLAVDALWLYKTNGNTLGGGSTVADGPAFIDKSNIAQVSKFAANGTR